MDITYLLWLQDLRLSAPPIVEQFFVVVSAIAASKALILLPCLLYWCLDKRAGQYLVFTFSFGTLLNQFVKNTVCAYRPWIRDAAISPAEGAIAEATGYSFPSGHTQTAGCLIGATGTYYRKRWPALFVLGWAFALLVAFSRNFLGVHTPQDVAVGLVESVLMVVICGKFLDWVDRGGSRDAIVLVVGLVVGFAYVAYVFLKPYPMDYDATGALLVDPVAMQVDCFKSGGVFIGAIVGWFMERRLVGFEVGPGGGWKRLVLRLAIGFAAVAALHNAPKLVLLATSVDERWLELAKNFLTIWGAAYVGPAIFTAIERRGGKGADAGRAGGAQRRAARHMRAA